MAQPKTVREIEALINKLSKLTEVADAAAVSVAELEAEGKDATEERKKEKRAKAAQKIAQDQYNKSVGESSTEFENLIDKQRKFKVSLEENTNVFNNLGIGARNLARQFEESTDVSGQILQSIAKRSDLIKSGTFDQEENTKEKEKIIQLSNYNKLFGDASDRLSTLVQDFPTSIGFDGTTTVDFGAREKRKQQANQLPEVSEFGNLRELAKKNLETADNIEDFAVGVNKKMSAAIKPAEELKNNIVGFTDKIPVVGGMISGFITDKFEEAKNVIGTEFQKALLETVGGTKAIGKGIQTNIGLQTIFNALTKMNPYARIAMAVIAIATTLATIFTISRKIGKAQRDLANELSMGKDQLDGQLKNLKLAEASFKVQNLDADKLKTTLVTLSTEFKDLSLVTAENAASIEKFAQNAGIGGDEVAKLTKQLIVTQGVSFDMALDMQRQAAAMAETAGLAQGRVLNDMASNAAEFARFSQDGAEGLAEAAVAANQMGLNLEKVLDVAGKLLDFESSITKEFEAQVLTGRALNLEAARQAALSGDQESLMREIKSVAMGVNLETMNVVQKDAIASAIGLSVSDLMRVSRGESLDKQQTQIDVQKKTNDILLAGFQKEEDKLDQIANNTGKQAQDNLYKSTVDNNVGTQ